MKRLLNLGKNRPTAVFASSDIQAIGALKALEEKKLKVPDDISLIGFDDIEFSQYLGLTTIKQPMYQMGKLAVKKIFERKSEEITQALKMILDTELIVRKSCKQINGTV